MLILLLSTPLMADIREIQNNTDLIILDYKLVASKSINGYVTNIYQIELMNNSQEELSNVSLKIASIDSIPNNTSANVGVGTLHPKEPLVSNGVFELTRLESEWNNPINIGWDIQYTTISGDVLSGHAVVEYAR